MVRDLVSRLSLLLETIHSPSLDAFAIGHKVKGRKRLGQKVSVLNVCINGRNLDNPGTNVLPEPMEIYVVIFGSRGGLLIDSK